MKENLQIVFGHPDLVAAASAELIDKLLERLRVHARLGLDVKLTPDAALALAELIERLTAIAELNPTAPPELPQETRP